VAFGGVSDSLGTDHIRCERAKPVTYRRDRGSPLDAARGCEVAKENARLERGDSSDPIEWVFSKTHQGQRVRYKLCPGGKRGGTLSQRVQGQLRRARREDSVAGWRQQ
jgi:hypothetical protein